MFWDNAHWKIDVLHFGKKVVHMAISSHDSNYGYFWHVMGGLSIPLERSFGSH